MTIHFYLMFCPLQLLLFLYPVYPVTFLIVHWPSSFSLRNSCSESVWQQGIFKQTSYSVLSMTEEWHTWIELITSCKTTQALHVNCQKLSNFLKNCQEILEWIWMILRWLHLVVAITMAFDASTVWLQNCEKDKTFYYQTLYIRFNLWTMNYALTEYS